MTRHPLKKLVVIGVGLIGGSFSLALRKAGAVAHVVGVGRTPENLQDALEVGAIDEIATDMESALKGADLVFLAMPVGQTGRVLAQIAPHLEPGTVVTDAGSTKQDVIAAARAFFFSRLAQFVPAHPIAGAEQSGAKVATAELYVNKNVILTPLEETSSEAVARVTDLWQACGARVTCMSPREHDQVLGVVSHFPHLLAFAFMERLSAMPNADRLFELAGSGFRDFTRIAGSSPEMWRDICMANRETLMELIDGYRDALGTLRELLAKGDADQLEKLFAAAREARRGWQESQERD